MTNTFTSALLALFLLAAPAAQAGWAGIEAGSAGIYAVKVTSLKEARFRTTVKQQYDFSCGSAALATLLTYQYRDPVTEAQVFKVMWDNGDREKIQREGFSLLDIKRYLEANGYRADGYEAPLHKLEQAGIPAIVLIRDNGYHHFVVVKGIRSGRVLLGDPSAGARTMSRAEFEKIWVNRILFVVTNRREQAVFNSGTDWGVRGMAPLEVAVSRDNLAGVTLLRPGPNDF
jgi:predicted double-glycine peptidase